MRLRFSLFGVLLLLFMACGAASQSGAEPSVQPKSNLPAGKLIPVVKAHADSSQQYALYLPKNYTHSKSWGVVYFFDAQGKGEEPVRRYQVLADLYEVVVVGSWNSRNGQTFGDSKRIFDALLRDTREKFSLDSNRTCLAGFSGGARVAAALAQQHPEIVAVIGCAAGFQPQAGDRFGYIGIVGVEDFNYQEMRLLDETLDRTPIHHMIEYFVGGHKWPPVEFMAKGFQFFQMRSMASGRMPKAEEAFQGMLRNYHIQDSIMRVTQQEQYRWVLQRKTIGYLEGLSDLTEIKALKAQLDSSAGVKAERLRVEQEFQQEMAMRQQYASSLQTAPLQYWQKAAPMLLKIGRHGQDEFAWMHMRVINFLSLNAFMLANQSLQNSDLGNADRYISIYALIDPSNSEHAYLRAQHAMRQNNVPGAYAALEQSFGLGNRDWQRMSADPAFAGIRSEAAFLDLQKRMQTTPPPDVD